MIERVNVIKKKKVLIPVDGTERSLHSLEFFKSMFKKENVEVTIMNVKEIVLVDGIAISNELDLAEEQGKKILKKAKEMISEYDVETYFTFGYARDEILKKAKEDCIDYIIMTKSTKKGLTRILGSVTTGVVRNANSVVMIVPE